MSHRFLSFVTSLIACALFLPGTCLAQLNTVTTAGSGETVQGVLSGQQGLARTADGRLWAMTYYNDGKGNNAKSQFDRIYVSSDNGKTWKIATTTRTPGSVRGSLRTGVDGRTLHVAWQANDSTSATAFYSVYYATYDTVKSTWNGSDFRVAKGLNSNNQYLSPDLVVTPKGTVVVCYNGHRQSSAWSGRMRMLKNNSWRVEQRINVDLYGIQQDCQVHGEDVYFAYRTNSGLYGIRCRRYDTEKEAWGAEGEMRVSQANTTNSNRASSGNNLVVLSNGDIYVIYAKGTQAAGKGEIWVGIALGGTYKFTKHVKVDNDPSLRGGNFTYYSYGLSRTGNRINVLYSKLSEKNVKLYLRWFIGSQLIPPVPVVLASGASREFEWISAHRNSSGQHGMMALLMDRGTAGGRVQALVRATDGASVFHGMGCAGKLALTPWLGASSLPSIGGKLDLAMKDMPKSTPALLFLGLSDRQLGPIPLPLSLAFIGMPGCQLVQDLIVTLGFGSKSNGTATMQLPMPNDQRFAGLPIYFQSFVVANGANGANALMTNGIAMTAR